MKQLFNKLIDYVASRFAIYLVTQIQDYIEVFQSQQTTYYIDELTREQNVTLKLTQELNHQRNIATMYQNIVRQYDERNKDTHRYYFNKLENTQEVRDMIKLLRKHLNKDMHIRVRARAKNRKQLLHAGRNYVRLADAEYLAIYIDRK